jgi:septal ring factor EnvC (AmiA/AmiB activator)
MADALEGVRRWAATVAASLAVALVIGGLNLHSDLRLTTARTEAVAVLAQATDQREQTLEKSVAAVDAKLEGLRRDIDRVADSVAEANRNAAEDRARILQELGRLQGNTEGPQRR